MPADKVPLLTDVASCWPPESAAEHGQHHPVATHHPDAGSAASFTSSPAVCQFPSTISLSRCVGPLLLVLEALATWLIIHHVWQWSAVDGLRGAEVTLQLHLRHVEKTFRVPQQLVETLCRVYQVLASDAIPHAVGIKCFKVGSCFMLQLLQWPALAISHCSPC